MDDICRSSPKFYYISVNKLNGKKRNNLPCTVHHALSSLDKKCGIQVLSRGELNKYCNDRMCQLQSRIMTLTVTGNRRVINRVCLRMYKDSETVPHVRAVWHAAKKLMNSEYISNYREEN